MSARSILTTPHFLQDSESVAEGLMTASEGKIRTGVYHADVNDGEKERLHHLWREGKVKVVCATIGAFFFVSFS